MGVGRMWRKKSVRRPKKTGTARRRRQSEHRKDVIAQGTTPAAVKHMTPAQVRSLRNEQRKATAKAARKAKPAKAKPAKAAKATPAAKPAK